MQKQINKVLEFHKAFNQPISEELNVLMPDARAQLRNRLVLEEVGELIQASGENDLTAIGDAIIDSMYILIGTAIEYGLHEKLVDMFDEVHSSNMSKLDDNGKPIYREDGKVAKSKNFKEPNLHAIIFRKENEWIPMDKIDMGDVDRTNLQFKFQDGRVCDYWDDFFTPLTITHYRIKK